MYNLRAILLTVSLGMGLPAEAADLARGERLFRDCTACHSVIDETGTAIVRGGRTGPNLYGVIGRHAGSVPGFHYSPSMVEAGRRGLRWNEADFAVYVRDATTFLRAYLDDPAARGKMAFKLPDADKARDVWAYLERIATP
jgi:cytochrome c